MLVLSIGLGFKAWQFIQTDKVELDSVKYKLDDFKSQAENAIDADHILAKIPKKDGVLNVTSVAISDIALAINVAAIEHGIVIQMLTASGASNGVVNSKFMGVSMPLTDDGVLKSKLTMKFTYTTFDGLQGFLRALENGPIVIRKISVSKNNADAVIDVITARS